MKTKFTRIISVMLVIIIFSSLTAVPTSAAFFTMSQNEWNTYWDSYIADGGAVCLSPGSDASEMGFAWMGKEECEPFITVKEAGTSDEYYYVGECVKVDSETYSYHAFCANLEPDTKYEYSCFSGAYRYDGTFKTAAAGDFTALFVTDIHVTYEEELPDNLRDVAGHVNDVFAKAYDKNNALSLIIASGDEATRGRLDEYVGAFASPLVKSVPFATVCGNHDYKDTIYPDVVNYPNKFNKEAKSSDRNGGDYWFVKGDVLFLMMNTNWVSSEDHHTFIEKAVEANPDVKWRVAVMHHDLYGGHLENREDENKLLRIMFPPMFDEFKIDLVLMGHSHIYSRSHVIYGNQISKNLTNAPEVTDANGTIYLTSGSASRNRGEILEGSDKVAFDVKDADANFFTLIDFKEDSITINAYTYENAEKIDTFTINKTTQDGGHIEESHMGSDFVNFIALLVAIFNKISFIVEKLFASIGIEL